jgi:hypothetical protein
MRSSSAMYVMVLFMAAVVARGVSSAEPGGRSATDWLAAFSGGWNEAAWHTPFRTAPTGYMRALDDADWKLRMEALQGVVAGGKDATGVLVAGLQAKDTPTRIFAAQALGFLAPDVPHEPLLAAAKGDTDAAVRLHAWDSLGMQGVKDLDFENLLAAEKNGDVRKHIGYVRERAGAPLDPAVVKQLKEWNSKTAGTAVVGRQAPDFTLKSATGETIRLSDFRGKSAVVLVFIYGDT